MNGFVKPSQQVFQLLFDLFRDLVRQPKEERGALKNLTAEKTTKNPKNFIIRIFKSLKSVCFARGSKVVKGA